MHQPVDRQFYTINSNSVSKSHFRTPSDAERETLVKTVADSIVGKNKTFSGPFGHRRVVYLDYIASGRALSFIEDYIQREVLPEYGNTHTTTSVTSLQTTLFHHEARDIIRNAVNASEHDSVIFSGSGTTGAIHKLLHALNLKEPPVIFMGPYEHHSNILPWKEISAEVVTIQQTKEGLVDLNSLEQNLKLWTGSRRRLIGSFSAASNVTGILCDVDAVTALLHKHGALAFWDYATAAPYIRLDMNPVVPGKDSALVYKDAIFFSPHKFVGGVNTPGVLIAKKRLFENSVPHECGGGTVFYVRREAHRYLREPELREEGGTPDIVGSIRAGLVLQLKSAITPELIMHKENELLRRAVVTWRSVPNLVILGNLEVERLPIFSFLVHHPASGLFLHHNFVACLLNDLFGIQSRGGCACAGPYAMDLLGLTEEKAAVLEELLAEDSRLDRVHLRRYMEYSHREILRPGFTRLNLPYFLSEEQVDFVLQAVALVAEHGWKLLPQYMFNPETGEWHHRDHQVFRERKWLGHISYASGRMEYSLPKVSPKALLPQSLEDCLNTARQLFSAADKSRFKLADQTLLFDEEARPYLWFLLPSEAAHIFSGAHGNTQPRLATSLPFCPQNLIFELTHSNIDTANVTPASVEDQKGSVSAEAGVPEEGAEKNKSCGKNRHSEGQRNSCGQCCYRDVSASHVQRTVDRTDESVSHVQRTVDRDVEEKEESFSQALQRAMKRGYCDSVLHNEESQTVKDRLPMDIVDTASSDPGYEMVTVAADWGDTVPESALQHDAVVSRGTVCEASAVVLSQLGGDSDQKSAVCDFLQEMNQSVHGTNCQLCHVAPETNSESNGVTSILDASQYINRASVFDDQLQETDRSRSSGVPISLESSLHSSSAGLKSRKKKKKKKKADAAQFIEKGIFKLQTGTPRAAHKGAELGNSWVAPTKDIFKPAVKAMGEFGMVCDGDRVLVCLSGGKDSLSLLHTMRQFQFYCRGKGIQFDLGAVTVDPQTSSYDPSPLKKVLADLGVPYFYESQCIMQTAVNLPYECTSICSFCSRMKRGRIYAAARREGYNVLALGQHLDDLAESFLMSLFHNGSLRTMKAHYTVQEGDLRVIRPFVYVREKALRNFAEKNHLPVIAENCPACFEAPKERHRTKQLLASQEVLFPHLYSSLLSAIRPVMAVSRTGVSAATILSTASKEDHDDDNLPI